MVAAVVQETVLPSSEIKASPITEADENLANLLVVPEPVIPPAAEQVTTLFDPSTQSEVPEPEPSPERVTVEEVERVVKAAVPGVARPIDVKLAAPAPLIFQSVSFNIKFVAVVRPMVMVPEFVVVPILVFDAPVPLMVVAPVKEVVPRMTVVSFDEPILIVSLPVLSVEILTILPAVPVPIFIDLALLPVPKFTLPVVPESRVSELVVAEVMVPLAGNAIDEFTFSDPVEST